MRSHTVQQFKSSNSVPMYSISYLVSASLNLLKEKVHWLSHLTNDFKILFCNIFDKIFFAYFCQPVLKFMLLQFRDKLMMY